MTMPIESGWATIGPFFHSVLPWKDGGQLAKPETKGERISILGRVLDAEGKPISDAMIEVWQANAAGRYDHPEDLQESKPLDPNFHGFGRVATDPDGRFRLRTIKPGPVPGSDEASQAPHINVSIFARGLLKRLVTRIYFPGEPLNETDALLSALPTDRRATLIARVTDADAAERVLHFDIVLQGGNETVFLDV
jgi:protocatechuate 3,4-dioxygenase alpha subunit